MTDDRNEDSEWLKDAFDRALRGDNGVAPDAARPAANPFGVAPTPADEEPVRHNELDLDFETESTVPPTAFLPIVDFGDDAAVDDYETEPDPFAVFGASEPTEAIELPQFEEAATVPMIQPSADAAPSVESTPTEAIDIVDAPTVIAPTVEPTPTSSVDGLDSLFGEDKFAAANTALIGAPTPTVPLVAPTKGRGEKPAKEQKAPRTVAPATPVTYGIAIGLIVLLGIGGFIAGSAIGGPSAKPVATATAKPKPSAIRDPGKWAWNDLYGGECIDPFPGAWAEDFTVVSCNDPHAAQLVAVGDLAEVTDGVFPGADSVAPKALEQCQKQGILNLETAGAYPNMRVSVAYAPTQKQWDAGNTSYYCFVSLEDGSPITGTVAGTGPAPAATP